MLARSMLLGALRWMKPKYISLSVLPNGDALLILSESAIGEVAVSRKPKPTFGKFGRESPIRIPGSGAPSPVIVPSVAFDENRSRDTRRLSVVETNAGCG